MKCAARYGTFECGRDKCATLHDETGDTFDHAFVQPPAAEPQPGGDGGLGAPERIAAQWLERQRANGLSITVSDAVFYAAREAYAAGRARGSEEERKRLLRLDTPWPLYDVLSILTEAVNHLLIVHNCDRHGYEGVDQALNAGRRIADAIAKETGK